MFVIGWVLVIGTTLFAVHAADVSPSTGVLAYVIDDSCPPGWTDLSSDGTYNGRLIKGWNSASNLGSTSGSAITDNSFPTHTHPSWSRRLYFPDSQRTSCLGQSSPDMVDDGAQFYITQSNTQMNSVSPNIARVALRLCRYTSGITFNLPPGFVVFVHHTINACPAGFSDFTDGHGRFLVFATSGKNMGSELISPGAPVTNNVDGVGYHTHNLPASTVTMKERWAAHILGCCGPTGATWIQYRTLEQGTASSGHLNIPYVQLRSCKSTTATASTGLPSSRTIFYYDGQTCPSTWRESSARSDTYNGYPWTNIAARMIFNVVNNNLATGQTNDASEFLYCATGSCNGGGQGTHTHNYGGTFDISPQQWSGCSWDWGLTYWTDYRSYTWYWDTDPTGSMFPYRVLRACSPQEDTKSPTNIPTRSPTTSKPTTSPTTSFPTLAPTRSPTLSAPTKSPTVSPTRSPTTSKPTLSPTYGSPTSGPTTSRPTKVPSQRPTWSPTPSPVWKNVCTTADLTQFVNYDNYVIQAAKCWSDCRVSILAGDATAAQKCISGCSSLSVYTPLCQDCMMFFIMTQDSKCRGACLSSKFSPDCVSCTNQYARPDFSVCTGFDGANIVAGGGDGGANAPKDEGVNPGIISGAALGGLLALAGVVVAGRRIRDRLAVNEQLAKEMEMTLFRGKDATTPAPPTGPKTFLATMFKSSNANKDSHSSVKKNNSIVAAEDTRESMDNPLFAATTTADSGTINVQGMVLRTRYSFHGIAEDELDVPAGTTLIAIEKNDQWYVCQDERTGKYGLIPATFVSTV